MATPTPDTYTVPAGQPIFAGLSSNPVAASAASAGSVSMLAKDWSGTGFQLLTTIPDGLFMVNLPGHSGSAWDEARQRLWVFGSETHGPAQTDNAVYCWDASTGLTHRMYDADPRTGAYHFTADGDMFADTAETRPWGMHTFRNLWYDPATKEMAVTADAFDHSYADSWSPLPGGIGYLSARKMPIWYYNTVTGQWRRHVSNAAHTFSTAELGAGLVRKPGDGCWKVGGNSLYHLSEDGNSISSYSIYGKLTSTLIQSYAHIVANDKLVLIGGDTDTQFGLVCDLSNPAGGDHHMLPLSLFPAISGWNVKNMWSMVMPDGRVMFGAYRGSPQQVGAFIFDWNNGSPTVTDTGYRLAASGGTSYYELRSAWSTKHNCAFIMSVRHGGHKVFGLRV